MKRLLALFVFLCIAGSATAQDAYIELLRSDVRANKVAILTAAMEFTDGQGETFWPIHREYEFELAKINDGRVALLKDYGATHDAMTDEKAKEISEASLKLEEQRLRLRRTYFKKFSKALNPVVAARWLQVENQIGLLISLQIAQELPLIEAADQ